MSFLMSLDMQRFEIRGWKDINLFPCKNENKLALLRAMHKKEQWRKVETWQRRNRLANQCEAAVMHDVRWPVKNSHL